MIIQQVCLIPTIRQVSHCNMDFNVSYIDVNMGALWSGRFGDRLSAYAE